MFFNSSCASAFSQFIILLYEIKYFYVAATTNFTTNFTDKIKTYWQTLLLIQLFRERLLEKVHATIPKGIVSGFEFTVLQRNLKEWHERQRRMFPNAKGKQQ